ncbi:MAG: phosphoadenylyl-sulfate reductase [Lentimicrobiaceae bacterium]|nr:phosphoadenylyl-sulfate reductase [Lentimicrobiaceae bacterium]
MEQKNIPELNIRFAQASPEGVIRYFSDVYAGKVAFASSLGAEDQVIMHLIATLDVPIHIFTLDTGRLFAETYDLLHKTQNRYRLPIRVYFPEKKEVEEMVNQKGINLFYNSLANRKQCCRVRKIDPLQRALQGMQVWICGLRWQQGITRTKNQMVEWDEQNQMLKVNPLIHWTDEQLWGFIRQNNIPYNILHDKGFPSIGCQPCTRSVALGEDLRSGRWWWENPENRECGLHKKD